MQLIFLLFVFAVLVVYWLFDCIHDEFCNIFVRAFAEEAGKVTAMHFSISDFYKCVKGWALLTKVGDMSVSSHHKMKPLAGCGVIQGCFIMTCNTPASSCQLFWCDVRRKRPRICNNMKITQTGFFMCCLISSSSSGLTSKNDGNFCLETSYDVFSKQSVSWG